MPRRKPAPPPRHGYHHGALRRALIESTESLLAERGVEGFSLREVARRSGVAPSAPAHHFGDAAGLLNAVATLAFDGLTEALNAGNARGGNDPVARLREQGIGYVGFAMRHPGRFNLMFRSTGHADDALRASARAAFLVLENGVRDLYGLAPGAPLAPEQSRALLAIWSVVHGFAHLAIAGQFDWLACGTARHEYVRQVLGPMLQQQFASLVQRPEKRTAIRRTATRARGR
jgi:AcrR family transcriptional regulator